MRCLTLANALRNHGAVCRFVCREHPGNLLDLIRKQGFEAIALPLHESDLRRLTEMDTQPLAHAAWLGTDWATDVEQTKVGAGDTAIDWLIVDHYALDARWESALRPRCGNIMVIDDLADRDHDCNLLLDQNLVADLNHRYDERVPAHCARLLGPEYALLQRQYAELHPCTPPRMGAIQRILVFFGGADNDNLTGRTIGAFLALKRLDIDLDVVINPISLHVAAIREQAQVHANITLHESLPSLAALMLKADLAIGAGGATSWERCCLGLPSLVITLAENQKPIVAELDRQGFVRWLGHQDTVSESTLKAALEDMLENERIEDWSRRCMTLTDGRGTERVATIVLLDSNTKLKARLARLDDEAHILRLANDPMVRQNAFNSNAIAPADHRVWFYKCLRDTEDCRIYIVEAEKGLPVGMVRFEMSDGSWNIDYALDAIARGRSLGATLLQTAMQVFRCSMSGALLFGRVKQGNLPSQKVFEELGFAAETGRGCLSIAICSDSGSWINESIPQLLLGWLAAGHQCAWAHSANELPGGDLCFYLSYSRIVDRATREKYRNNLVVHESDLPKGKGWSPLTWQILEGQSRIPVTLIEAAEEVDSGVIYAQRWIEFHEHEFLDELRASQAFATYDLCRRFVAGYPITANQGREQTGEESFYPRRRPVDSELDPEKSVAEQFNLLRVVDNERYPAFFNVGGHQYFIKVIPSKTHA